MNLPPQQAPKADHLLWADFIRVISVLFVVLGHVTAIPLVHGEIASMNWITSATYNTLARVCVPLLFMVSGALLLPKQETLRDFYEKRLQKVAVPFLFWSFLYLYAANIFDNVSLLTSVKLFVREIAVQPAEYHLWFMYDLFLLYLLTPLIRIFVQNANEKMLWYFMAIWFVFGPIQTEAERLIGVEIMVDLGHLTGYLGYFVLGYILNRITLTKEIVRVASLVYLSVGVFTVWALRTTSLARGALDPYYQTLTGWNIALLSIATYVLLKAIGTRIFSAPHPRLEVWMKRLASASFGIYLVHIFVLRYLSHPFIPFFRGLRKILSRYALDPMSSPVVLTSPLITLAIFLVSWVVIALLRKIPYIRSTT